MSYLPIFLGRSSTATSLAQAAPLAMGQISQVGAAEEFFGRVHEAGARDVFDADWRRRLRVAIVAKHRSAIGGVVMVFEEVMNEDAPIGCRDACLPTVDPVRA